MAIGVYVDDGDDACTHVDVNDDIDDVVDVDAVVDTLVSILLLMLMLRVILMFIRRRALLKRIMQIRMLM